MAKVHHVLAVFVLFSLLHAFAKASVISKDGSEEWGYVEVRPRAHMFWWLYRSPNRVKDSSKPWPVILWLQGGPGGSGVGIGNFQEIGPLDTDLNPRNSTWLQIADLLFADNPVGTGYSFVENASDASLFVKTDAEAADDLTALLTGIFNSNEGLQKSPLYIVAESYGGKFAVTLALAALKAIEAGKLKLNLGGVALGNSWISPEDFVFSWPPLLKDLSRLDNRGVERSTRIAERIRSELIQGKYVDATVSWSKLEDVISSSSNSVDFYNFLLDSSMDGVSLASGEELDGAIPARRYLTYLNYLKSASASSSSSSSPGNPNGNSLIDIMEGPIRKKLGIIPKDVSWGGQSDSVFGNMEAEFMKPRINEVDELLAKGVNVTVYNGQVRHDEHPLFFYDFRWTSSHYKSFPHIIHLPISMVSNFNG
ncbi:hypothetical protein SAY87_012966 [Trapa incisa]|uniref:Carboxypeptidase n=1 Tax=Trapa incisa TaxID=236973 RepID=A0AAN7K7W0_9MYRT|nr:hypothetical protein SAY87_012966 [Trapa incisa]